MAFNKKLFQTDIRAFLKRQGWEYKDLAYAMDNWDADAVRKVVANLSREPYGSLSIKFAVNLAHICDLDLNKYIIESNDTKPDRIRNVANHV